MWWSVTIETHHNEADRWLCPRKYVVSSCPVLFVKDKLEKPSVGELISSRWWSFLASLLFSSFRQMFPHGDGLHIHEAGGYCLATAIRYTFMALSAGLRWSEPGSIRHSTHTARANCDIHIQPTNIWELMGNLWAKSPVTWEVCIWRNEGHVWLA